MRKHSINMSIQHMYMYRDFWIFMFLPKHVYIHVYDIWSGFQMWYRQVYPFWSLISIRQWAVKLDALLARCKWFKGLPVGWCPLKFDSFANPIRTGKELKVLPKIQTWCVHKAMLTEQRSGALNPMFLPQASKILSDKIELKPWPLVFFPGR